MTDAEFRGFFMGEGYLGLHTYKRHGKQLLRAQVKIALRADDAEILDQIKERFGGHIFGKNKKYAYWDNRSDTMRKPIVQWMCVSKKELLELYKVLSKTKLKSKKMRELEVWKEFVDLIPGKGKKYSEEQRAKMLSLIDELKSVRHYKE